MGAADLGQTRFTVSVQPVGARRRSDARTHGARRSGPALQRSGSCRTLIERVAQRVVSGGFANRYDYASQTLSEIPYEKWREYDPEDTMRFYALRLHESGLIKSSPNKIIADGTDWRFLNELKRELKA